MVATRRNLYVAMLATNMLLIGSLAQAQVPQTNALGRSPLDLSTPAMKYFGHGQQAPLSRPPSRHQAPQTRTYQLSGNKPFQNVSTQQPTVTPYLGLDTVEIDSAVPAYFTRVLPRLQQQQANQTARTELMRLQKQARSTNRPGNVASNRSGGVPTTGHGYQFLNHGGYFPTAQR